MSHTCQAAPAASVKERNAIRISKLAPPAVPAVEFAFGLGASSPT